MVPYSSHSCTCDPPTRKSAIYTDSIAILSPRNTAICTLILASFRRLLPQEGAFLHQIKLMLSLVVGGYNSCTLKLQRMPIWNSMFLFQKRYNLTLQCTLDISKIDLQRLLPFIYDTLHAPPWSLWLQRTYKQGNKLRVCHLTVSIQLR